MAARRRPFAVRVKSPRRNTDCGGLVKDLPALSYKKFGFVAENRTLNGDVNENRENGAQQGWDLAVRRFLASLPRSIPGRVRKRVK
jgi:hypothetical protein